MVLAEDAQNLSNAFGNEDSALKKAGEAAGYGTKKEDRDIDKIIGNVIFQIFSFVGVIFLILMVYGGFLWMTAAGSEEKTTKAKKLLTAALVGIIIVVGAGAVSYFVINFLMK